MGVYITCFLLGHDLESISQNCLERMTARPKDWTFFWKHETMSNPGRRLFACLCQLGRTDFQTKPQKVLAKHGKIFPMKIIGIGTHGAGTFTNITG